jgi:aldehyde dehydrogenase (NAD+)
LNIFISGRVLDFQGRPLLREYLDFYIDGAWVAPAQELMIDVINPANEQVAGRISLGTAVDVDKAALAARRAFPSWSQTSRRERIALLERIAQEYERRRNDIADAITEEMGAPTGMSHASQAGSGLAHIAAAITVLRDFAFEEPRGSTMIVKEPIGVCGLITPWNWPLNQIACKVAPALATGCTIILKPSEIAPFSAVIFAEVLHAAGVPAGVFNLVNGDGPGAGAAIASHPEVDMVSFTGSTRAGVAVAMAAAPTVKRVAQELGGKSPVILLDDADFPKAVAAVVRHVMGNSGQSCNAPTRMLVPEARMDEVIALARATAESIVVGDPLGAVDMGPVVSSTQWGKIQDLITTGVAEGATLVTGGLGRPDGLDRGYYVKPTIFAHVENAMTIAQEEIFGPVLSILGYRSCEQAVEIGNDTDYGLAAYIWGGEIARMRRVAAQLRAGRVGFNGVGGDTLAPFGGYKMSGNGREWGDYGFAEFLEVKAMLGYEPA